MMAIDTSVILAIVLTEAPLLFKGQDFGRTDLKIHPASSKRRERSPASF